MATYVRWGGTFYHQTTFMIDSKQLAKNYYNRLNWVVVIVRQSWRVFLNHSVVMDELACRLSANAGYQSNLYASAKETQPLFAMFGFCWQILKIFHRNNQKWSTHISGITNLSPHVRPNSAVNRTVMIRLLAVTTPLSFLTANGVPA